MEIHQGKALLTFALKNVFLITLWHHIGNGWKIWSNVSRLVLDKVRLMFKSEVFISSFFLFPEKHVIFTANMGTA